MQPNSTVLSVRGLDLQLWTWEPPAEATPSGLTILLLHGFADTAASFDLVLPSLARAGHRIVAPDLRGFGDSSWIGAGGYYHFPNYLADVVDLLRQLAPERLAVVAHSMGGTIAVQLAGVGVVPIEKLVLMEGLGPPAHSLDLVPDRFRRWLDALETHRTRPEHRSFSSMEAVVERLVSTHPGVPVEVLRTRAPLLVKQRDDGRYVWKFDPLHRTVAPVPFLVDAFKAFLRRIACPTLVIHGGPTGFHTEDEEARIEAIPDVRVVDIPDAGHMMHWTRPEQVSRAIVQFLG